MVFGLKLADNVMSFLGFGGSGDSAATVVATDASEGGLEFREYYAAACPHCVHLAPEWKAATEQYSGPVHFRAIECADKQWNPVEANANLCKDIDGFPTLKLFKGEQEVEEYHGARTASALVDFAKSHESLTKDHADDVATVTTPVATVERTEGSATTSGLEFREYYSSACPHCVHLAPEWKAATEQYTGPVHFRAIECFDKQWHPVQANAKLCRGARGFPTMKLFNGEKEVAEYDGDRTASALMDFAKAHENLAKDRIEDVSNAAMPAAVVAPTEASTTTPLLQFREYYASACPHCVHLAPAWKAATEQYNGPVQFRAIECADKQWNPVEANAKLCEDIQSYPTLKLFNGEKEVETYYGDRTVSALLDFAKAHEDLAKGQVNDVASAAMPGAGAAPILGSAKDHIDVATAAMPASFLRLACILPSTDSPTCSVPARRRGKAVKELRVATAMRAGACFL